MKVVSLKLRSQLWHPSPYETIFKLIKIGAAYPTCCGIKILMNNEAESYNKNKKRRDKVQRKLTNGTASTKKAKLPMNSLNQAVARQFAGAR